MSDDEIMTVEEAMRFLKIGRAALYRAIACNEIPHRRIGKLIRMSRRALIDWVSRTGPENR